MQVWTHSTQEYLKLYFNRFTHIITIFILASLLVFGITNAEAVEFSLQIDETAYQPDELLIKFKKNIIRAQASNLATTYGATSAKPLVTNTRGTNSPLSQWQLIKVPRADLRALSARLAKDPNIESVELNHRISINTIPNDPFFSNQWNLHNIGQLAGIVDADIDAPEAWNITTGSGNEIVAVVDTGIDLTHPDLINNLWVNTAEIPGNLIDDDGNGYVDDVHGYDFFNRSSNLSDENGHGTHVAGIIAAQGNNNIGVSGVSWNTRIMPLRFLGAGGSGTISDAIEAIHYAANMNAKIINASWSLSVKSRALADAIQMTESAGILFVAAAGNNGNNTDITPTYPANYAFENIVSVAATTNIDSLANFSNYGVNSVDIGAPGVGIYSTIPVAGGVCCFGQSGYALLDGTSMAAPHVSGAAALLLANNPALSSAEIKDRIILASDLTPGLVGLTSGGGRLNIASALESDVIAPSAVTDLSAAESGSRSFVLQWSASGDDGVTGIASGYDLRYSNNPIDTTNFESATSVRRVSSSGPAGSTMSFVVNKLKPDTQYYIALKARDNVGNKSDLSNVISVTTKSSTVVYLDDIEQGVGNWAITGSDGVGGPSLWHVTSQRFNSATQAFYYGRENNLTYNTGARNFGEITSSPIDLSNAKDSWLMFSQYLAIEGDIDTASVQVSSDSGATWQDVLITTTSTDKNMFAEQSIDLSAYDGQIIQLRFSFDTRDNLLNGFEGWYVDDIQISATAQKPANNPPIANPGGPYTIQRGQPVTLFGTGSTDPDGDVLTYNWDFGDGSVGTGAIVQHQYQNMGQFTVALVVSDGKLSSLPVTTTVSVNNAPPLANAGSNKTVKPKKWTQLNGTASRDLDGGFMSHQWRQVSGKKVKLKKANTALAAFRTPKAECGQKRKLVFELTVTDSDAATSIDRVTINVYEKCD